MCSQYPRNLNPSVICVILVFSSESVRLSSDCRKSFTSPFISSTWALVPLQRITQSSAYRTYTKLDSPCARRFLLDHSFSAVYFRIYTSNSWRYIFASKGLMIPPCGVPVMVLRSFPFSRTPARKNFHNSSRISLSCIRFLTHFISLRWGIVSKDSTPYYPCRQLTR